jgi:hypothetical protein
MSTGQGAPLQKSKQIGEWLVVWRNGTGDDENEFHFFHDHSTDERQNLFRKVLVDDKEKDIWTCRNCKAVIPKGVLYFGKTRALSEDG